MPTAQAHWSPVPPALTLRPGAGTPPPTGSTLLQESS